MKLFYVTHARIPTERAHGLQIIKMCEAFQHAGIEVLLIVPTCSRSEAVKDVNDIGEYYEVKTPFAIQFIRTFDFLPFERRLPSVVGLLLLYIQSTHRLSYH